MPRLKRKKRLTEKFLLVILLRVSSLKKAFPESFITHALAVKANSIRGVLSEANNHGLGGECASLQEAKHCLSIGFPPQNIIFDSPVKTPLELIEAIELGFHMNLDNEREARIKKIVTKAYSIQSVLKNKQLTHLLAIYCGTPCKT